MLSSIAIVLPATYTEDLNVRQNYQMTSFASSNSVLFPTTADIFRTGGARNYEKISDPKIDAAIEQIQTATNQDGVRHAVDSLLQEEISQYDVIPAQAGLTGISYDPSKVGGVGAVQFGITGLWGAMYLKNP
jgi:ABC-type oligopeptide transport system substrate-binding subunit